MEYQPGSCNIGRAELRKRAYLGIAGFLFASAVLTGIIYLGLSVIALLPLFAGFSLGFEGYFQTRYRFCAGFAMQGIYDVSEEGGNRHEVPDSDAHRQDLRQALKIHLYSFLSAGAVTYLAFSMIYP
ncbi:MAG: hypothetical protein SV186_05385 [Candidatus Nanohaloarchaea archaeon]|nr:hypothetical protein [Candidatus Nanohaloarchaea archaeon]